jgi:hypothetical protein
MDRVTPTTDSMSLTPLMSKNPASPMEESIRCFSLRDSDWCTPTMRGWYISAATEVAVDVWALIILAPQLELRAAQLLVAFSITNLTLLPAICCELRNKHRGLSTKSKFLLSYVAGQVVCDGVLGFISRTGNPTTQSVALVYLCFHLLWIVISELTTRAE